MRSLRLVMLALLATAAKADLFSFVEASFTAPPPWVVEECHAGDFGTSSAGCGFSQTQIDPDPVFGGHPITIRAGAFATASYGSLVFSFIAKTPINPDWPGAVTNSASAGFSDTVYLGGVRGTPAIARFFLSAPDDPCFDQRDLNNFGASFIRCGGPSLAVEGGGYSFDQSVALGEPLLLSMSADVFPFIDPSDDRYFDSSFSYNISSIQLLDLQGHELTGLRYSTAAGARYPIDGALFVPEPSTVLLLLTVTGVALLGKRKQLWRMGLKVGFLLLGCALLHADNIVSINWFLPDGSNLSCSQVGNPAQCSVSGSVSNSEGGQSPISASVLAFSADNLLRIDMSYNDAAVFQQLGEPSIWVSGSFSDNIKPPLGAAYVQFDVAGGYCNQAYPFIQNVRVEVTDAQCGFFVSPSGEIATGLFTLPAFDPIDVSIEQGIPFWSLIEEGNFSTEYNYSVTYVDALDAQGNLFFVPEPASVWLLLPITGLFLCRRSPESTRKSRQGK